MIEAREISRAHYDGRYEQVPSWLGQYDVWYFSAELGPIYKFYSSYLRDPQHEIRVVFLTDCCVKVAETLTWEAYDCWRL